MSERSSTPEPNWDQKLYRKSVQFHLRDTDLLTTGIYQGKQYNEAMKDKHYVQEVINKPETSTKDFRNCLIALVNKEMREISEVIYKRTISIEEHFNVDKTNIKYPHVIKNFFFDNFTISNKPEVSTVKSIRVEIIDFYIFKSIIVVKIN